MKSFDWITRKSEIMNTVKRERGGEEEEIEKERKYS